MKVSKNQPFTDMEVVFRTFQFIAVLGLIYCLIALVSSGSRDNDTRLLVYATWFALAISSIDGILAFAKAGAYILVGATLAVTIYDIAMGYANLGGAMLGALVAFVVATYVAPIWKQFE